MRTGIFSPTTDDVFRLVLLAIGVLNIAVVGLGLLAMRRYARLLLDVEQVTREARNRLREHMDTQLRTVVADIAQLSAELAELRRLYEQLEGKTARELDA